VRVCARTCVLDVMHTHMCELDVYRKKRVGKREVCVFVCTCVCVRTRICMYVCFKTNRKRLTTPPAGVHLQLHPPAWRSSAAAAAAAAVAAVAAAAPLPSFACPNLDSIAYTALGEPLRFHATLATPAAAARCVCVCLCVCKSACDATPLPLAAAALCMLANVCVCVCMCVFVSVCMCVCVCMSVCVCLCVWHS